MLSCFTVRCPELTCGASQDLIKFVFRGKESNGNCWHLKRAKRRCINVDRLHGSLLPIHQHLGLEVLSSKWSTKTRHFHYFLGRVHPSARRSTPNDTPHPFQRVKCHKDRVKRRRPRKDEVSSNGNCHLKVIERINICIVITLPR